MRESGHHLLARQSHSADLLGQCDRWRYRSSAGHPHSVAGQQSQDHEESALELVPGLLDLLREVWYPLW